MLASMSLARLNLRSVSKSANPIGASRSNVANSAVSDASSPDRRGCGTDVSVLIVDTSVARPALLRGIYASLRVSGSRLALPHPSQHRSESGFHHLDALPPTEAPL